MENEHYVKSEQYKTQRGQKLALARFQKRDLIVKVRLNVGELELLDSLREIYECSRAEYARRAISENHPHQIPAINKSAMQELSKIGNNLNQVAKNINSKERVEIAEIQQILSNLKEKLIGADFE